MKMKYIILAGSVALGSSLMSTTSAIACSCSGAIAATRAAVNTQGGRTQDELRTLQDLVEEQTEDMNENHDDMKDHLDIRVADLIEALKGQARENANYQQMQVEAAQRIEDASQVNATQRLRDEFRAKAESGVNDPNPFSCMILDMFGNGGGGAPNPDNTGSAVVSEVVSFVDGETPEVQSGGVRMASVVSNDKDELENFKGSPNASTDWSLMLKEPTVDMDDPQTRKLAGVLVRNTINTSPERSVPEAEKATPLGLGKIAKMEETRARYKAAMESIAMQLNMRTAVMDGDAVETYRDMATDSAYNREIPEKLSELQQIDIMTVWNYAPKGERAENLTDNAKMSEKAWLFELHRIMSINARINYLNLELASRDAVVNAAILATLNDDD
ncbi:hypothetical protein [Pseudosulfitobacter pseudonitzschiae]|uniref:hypothetical protein n=1 Tax=Pseudosulfitobacter pseudonitzschiae TaxID=1402135 RepID=UPI003B7DEAE7